MHPRTLCFVLSLTLVASPALCQSKTSKEYIEHNGKKRVYYLFVPETLDPAKPAPLLVTLHAARTNGKRMIVEWEQMARKRGIILVSPNALNDWFAPGDWPDFLHSLVQSIEGRFNIDPRRVYLFGASAGGIHSAMTAVLEPEYFAAVAVIGGYLPKKVPPLSKNRIPIAFWVGDRDPILSVDAVRNSAAYLRNIGFPVRVTIIEGVGHIYQEISGHVNDDIWSFLGSMSLSQNPRWIEIDPTGIQVLEKSTH